MANYEVYFSNAGVPETGLTLTWETLKKYSDGTDESSQPAFTEIGGGWYKFSYSPSGTMIGVVDGSATLGDTDRYIPCKFTTDDGVIAITGDLMGLADDAIKASKFDESTAFPVKSADSGGTQIARVGADGDTLETLSDQIDGVYSGTPPTPSEIADQIWDEGQADHLTAGSFGKQIDSTVSDLDNPDQFKADLSSVALVSNQALIYSDTQALVSAGTPPTPLEIDAELTSKHGSGLWASGGATGANQVIISIIDGNSDPLPDVNVTVLNSDQTVTLDGKVTDSLGQVTFALDNDTYKIRLRKSFVSFTVPETLVVSGDTTISYSGSVFSPALPSAGLQNVYGEITDPSLAGATGASISAVSLNRNQAVDSRVITKQKLIDTSNGGLFSLTLAKGGLFRVTGILEDVKFLDVNITVTEDDTKNISSYIS